MRAFSSFSLQELCQLAENYFALSDHNRSRLILYTLIKIEELQIPHKQLRRENKQLYDIFTLAVTQSRGCYSDHYWDVWFQSARGWESIKYLVLKVLDWASLNYGTLNGTYYYYALLCIELLRGVGSELKEVEEAQRQVKVKAASLKIRSDWKIKDWIISSGYGQDEGLISLHDASQPVSYSQLHRFEGNGN